MVMTRREVLALLTALPAAVRLTSQTRATGQLRFAVAHTHGLLIEPAGTLKSWMNDASATADVETEAHNALGLGRAGPIYQHTLYPVAGISNVVAAAAGAGTSFAVVADGRIFAWGTQAGGLLGTTPLAEYEERAQPRPATNTPTPVAVRFDAVNVVSTSDHVLALTRTGTVYAWGSGSKGQLGIGPLPTVHFKTRSAGVMPEAPYPVLIAGLTGVTAIAAGNGHSLALLNDGTLRAWGQNDRGQVGDGTTINRDRPAAVRGVTNAVAIAAGSYFSLAVLADGTVMEWGAGIQQSDARARTTPALVVGARGVRSAVAGLWNVAAITQTGDVMTWGDSAHYETGRGVQGSLPPGLVKGPAGARSLASATNQTIVVTESGRIWTWAHVRPWTRPGGGGYSPSPILLWIDGLEYL
jgi:alpha-tubulin suppressor-like RCC1 family protein